MNKRKLILLFSVVLLFVVLSAGLLYLNNVKKYKDTVKQMTFNALDTAGIADGVYTGECDVSFIYVKAAVTVNDGRIQTIDLLEHKNGRGAQAEAIIGRIVEAQSLEVDAVAGATNSCKVIKKAVENAVRSAA